MDFNKKLPLNQLIRTYRKQKGYTQVELSELAKVSQSLISNLEANEDKSISFRTVVCLCVILGFSLDQIDLDSYSSPQKKETENPED